jgi:hypothetical protein
MLSDIRIIKEKMSYFISILFDKIKSTVESIAKYRVIKCS